MNILCDSEIRELLPLREAARVVDRELAGCEYTAQRVDLFRQTAESPVQAFRLKASIGTGGDRAFARLSTGVADLFPIGESIVSHPVTAARPSGLLFVYCLQSGALLRVLEDAYVWALSLALSASVTVARCLREIEPAEIGVLGTGRQATLQLLALSEFGPGCRFSVFDPRAGEAESFCSRLRDSAHLDCRPAASSEECSQGDALLVATSAFLPEIPDRWPARRLRVISVTRASEASRGTLRDAAIVVTASNEERLNLFADRSAVTRLWAQRRANSRRSIPLLEFIRSSDLPDRVVFACLDGFTGGPVLGVLIDEIDRRLVSERVPRGHWNSSGRPS